MAKNEQLSFLDSKNNLTELDRFERLRELMYDEGFYPYSKIEQSDAIGVRAFSVKQGGAAGQVAEISRHQDKAGFDPKRTALRVVGRYISYAEDAQKNRLELGVLTKTLGEIDNPHHKLPVVDVTHKTPGVLSIIRFRDMQKLAQTESINSIGYDPQLVKYYVDNAGIMALAEIAVDSMQVHEVRKQLPIITQAETSRYEFWNERLAEVSKYSYRTLAQVAIDGMERAAAVTID